MQTFQRIEIHGYRRLFDVQLELRPLAVLIGANGVGKTALLEVFSLLAASADGRLERKLAEAGGLRDVLTRDRTESLRFSLRMAVPNREPLVYSLEVATRGPGYEIAEETLAQHSDPSTATPYLYINSRSLNVRYAKPGGKGSSRPTWDHSPFETSLSQVPKLYQWPELFRNRLAACTFYGALNVAPRSPVRLPQSMHPASLPGPDGEDLVSCLYYLRETDRDRFDAIEETLRTAFPDFERLNFPPVAAGTMAMTWKDANFQTPFYMHQLSEGTLRFLWLVTLLHGELLPAVTLIDEPEVSLHPEMLRVLAALMRQAAQRTSLVVATHADRLVRFLHPNEILACDAEEGLTQLTWADSLDLERWMDEYSLDQLWAMNIMGGRG